jgi:hypothetical protein
MSIVYDPKKMLRKLAPERKVKKLLSSKVTVKKTALSFLDDADFIDKDKVLDVALKTVSGYHERIAKAVVDAGFDRSAGTEVKNEIVDDPKQLIQRVQNQIVTQISQEISKKYEGEKYIWLPSDAEEPDPEHQLNYGKEFIVGVGEMPGERPGCKCGMEILTTDTKLEL